VLPLEQDSVVDVVEVPELRAATTSVVVGLAVGGALLLCGGFALVLTLVLQNRLHAPGPFILGISTEILWCAGGATLAWSWIKYRRVRKRSGPVTLFAGCLLWLLSVGAVLGVLLFLVVIGVGVSKK
jgi:hypothetical protein